VIRSIQVIDALKALDIKIGTVYVLDIDLEAIGVGVHHHRDVVIKILKTTDAHGAVYTSPPPAPRVIVA